MSRARPCGFWELWEGLYAPTADVRIRRGIKPLPQFSHRVARRCLSLLQRSRLRLRVVGLGHNPGSPGVNPGAEPIDLGGGERRILFAAIERGHFEVLDLARDILDQRA